MSAAPNPGPAGRPGAHSASRQTRRRIAAMPPVVLPLLLSIFAAVGATTRSLGEGGAGPSSGIAEAQQSLYVMVRDDNQFVKGLGEENFEVYEGQERRPFELREPEPARIALLVEYTHATQSYLGDVLNAMRGFENVAAPGHWYALASYGDVLNIATDFTKRRGKIAQAFLSLELPQRGEIAAYDAIYAMIDRMSWVSGRRVLIVIGSGFDSASREGQDDILRRLDAAGVVVFALGTLSPARRAVGLNMSFDLELRRRQAFLERMAERSGGFARFPLVEKAFASSMTEILAGIDAQYELVSAPVGGSDGSFRRIEVKAFRTGKNGSREDFQVSVRDRWRP